MKSLLTWTERRPLRLFGKLSNRHNFHRKAEMFSFHSKYFVYRELKRAPQKLSFCFKCPDTGLHTLPSLALNYPCKEYQIIYESVRIYLCTWMRNKYPCKGGICMKCPHTSHVEVDQFLNFQHAWVCWDMVARGIVFESPRLTVKCMLSLTK